MRTIVEPKEHIDKLWGKQRIRDGDTYRMMRYVLRVDHEGKVLLHNVVTGRLVVLDETEAEALETLPAVYRPEMELLVTEHYLVPEDYDERQQVKNLQAIFRYLEDTQRYHGITTYTILTTTACNARCYYCYEQGGRIATMNEQTANDVVDYIVANCGQEKKVFLRWFGGEPTLTVDRISQICTGLESRGIQYQSIIITNGYLLNESIVTTGKSIWNLTLAQICLDGVEENYNRIKAFVGVTDNPFQTVMRNIGLLLNANIKVAVRMNFDKGNYRDFKPLLEELKYRFPDNPLLRVSAHPIIGAYPDHDGIVLHGSDEWFGETMLKMDAIISEVGMAGCAHKLPSLCYKECMAARDYATTITPEGFLVRCPEQYEEDQITGNLKEGITNHETVKRWKEIAEYNKCKECLLFPECISVIKCRTSGLCMLKSRRLHEITDGVVSNYISANR